MQNDDLLPNESPYFGLNIPVEREIARKKKQAQTLEAMPVLKELLERLQNQVNFLGSVDSIPDEAKTHPEEFMHIHMANELARSVLRNELEYLEGLITTYSRG